MQKHPDADSFVLEHLRRPTNATTRLVFADWLEETGTPSNVAWARYIRLREESDRHAPDAGRRPLLRQADEHATQVRAKLAIAAQVFVRQPESILQLIPAANITIRFADFEIPRAILELVPESIARENYVLPITLIGNALFCASTDPRNIDAAQRLTFILNRDIVLVDGYKSDLIGVINRAFGQTEEAFDCALREYAYQPLLPNDPPDLDWLVEPASATVRFVNMLFREAIERRVDQIHITPEPTGMVIFYLADAWSQYGWVPPRLQPQALARIALMARIPVEWTFRSRSTLSPIVGEFPIQAAGIRFRVRVTMHPSSNGPTTQIDLIRESVETA